MIGPDHIDFDGYAVIAPRLDMEQGDFRFMTQRESCRSSVRRAYRAAIAVPDVWNRISLSQNAEAARLILSEVDPYVMWDIGHIVAHEIREIATKGWHGYMADQVAAHAVHMAFVPAPLAVVAAPGLVLIPVPVPQP